MRINSHRCASEISGAWPSPILIFRPLNIKSQKGILEDEEEDDDDGLEGKN